jgi:GTP-binding protein EngB required for normal cell division
LTKKYDDALREISALGTAYHLKGVPGEAASCGNAMAGFSIKLLFVGQTSTGKSAFINSLLGRGEFLKEEQSPETSIATELVYDADEHVELVDESGGRTRSPFDQVQAYDPNGYNHYEYHLNNEYVKNLAAFTMVDMPGTESGIELHNKAIMRYICQGNAFILVIDGNKGTVQESVAGFINEIKQYDDNLGIVVTKADTKPDIEAVRAVIEENAALLFGKRVVTIAASKFDDNREKFNAVLNSFDPQDLFEQKFGPSVIKVARLCLAGMENVKKALSLDDAEIEREIERREKAKAEYEKEFTENSAKLSRKLKNYAKPQIIADAQDALYGSADALASCAVSNPAGFSSVANNILRPVFVTSTQRYIDECFDEFISGFDFGKIFGDEDAQKMAGDITERTGQFTQILDKIVKTGDAANGTYKAVVGVLSIATSVVAPWLELILFFLPDIIKGLQALFGKSPQEKAREKIETEIIPQIISRIEPKISETLAEFEREKLAEIRAEIDKRIEVADAALRETKKERADKKAEFDKRAALIDADLTKIKGIVSTLEADHD